MARKTSRRIQPKTNPPSREDLLNSAARTMQERFPDKKIRPHQEGEEKMSDVLEEFLDPYLADAPDDDAYQKLMAVGVIAWNIALMEKGKQIEAIDKLAHTLPAHLRQDLTEMFAGMIARKERLFAHNQRRIVDYQLTDLGGQWHLSVVSSLPPQEE